MSIFKIFSHILYKNETNDDVYLNEQKSPDLVPIINYEKPKLVQKVHGWILQFQTGLKQLREKREIAAKAFLVTLVIWINASIRFGLIVYAVTGNVEAAGLIILASGLVYSIGTFLP